MLPTMLLVKKVREIAGLNPWAMHKLMGKNSIQAYLSLERSAKRISLADYFQLEKIWVERNCGSSDEFHRLARECATKEKT